MKKLSLLTILAILFSATISFAQKTKTGNALLQPSAYSLFAGYGSQGLDVAADMNLSSIIDLKLKNASTRFYVDFGLSGKKFTQPNFMFNSVNYSSDVTIFDIDGGFSEEFLFANNHLTITPYIGLRYEKARFKDKSLVSAIGQYNLIRHEYDGSGNLFQVGPTVLNGYGDATTIDAGVGVGYKINKTFEISAKAGFSPVTYSTSGTLFGKYWGEAPYTNPYYINRSSVRFQGGLRINL
jgi:hypothetical protein